MGCQSVPVLKRHTLTDNPCRGRELKKLILALVLLWPMGSGASDRADIRVNCMMSYSNSLNLEKACKRAQTLSRAQLRRFSRPTAYRSNAWPELVNACYRESPGVVRGIDYVAALQCFRRERQRITKEKNQPPPPQPTVKRRNQPVVPLNKDVPERAFQGDADAQNFLGFMFANGDDVPEDYVQAYVWWSLAAAQGHENASMAKEIIRKDMTPAQIAEAQKLSRELCAIVPGCVK